MTKKYFMQKVVSVVAVAMIATLIQVQAADMAAASGTLADVAVMAVQAKANLAVAANSGDINAVSEAMKRADAVDSALASAQEALAALDIAKTPGDESAATSALDSARQKAFDALNGPVPEAVQPSVHDQWKESQTNTGGGPGRAYDPPNIYDVPWQTQGLRHFYQSMFGNFWSASSHGGSHSFGDRDATPE